MNKLTLDELFVFEWCEVTFSINKREETTTCRKVQQMNFRKGKKKDYPE